MSATVTLRPVTHSKTEVTMSAAFEPKFGLLGKLMAPMMKRQFRSLLASVLAGNAAYVENGAAVPRAA